MFSLLPDISTSDPSHRGPSRARSLPIGIALAVVAAVVGGGLLYMFGRSGGNVALALSLKQGQSLSYRLHLTMGGTIASADETASGGVQPIAVEMSEDISWHVASVDRHGNATIQIRVADITGKVNGRSVSFPRITSEMRLAPDGRILSGSALGSVGGGASGLQVPGSSQVTPLLPGRSIGPGDTWNKTVDQPFPFGPGRLRFISTNTYLRNEDVNGEPTAVIRTTGSLPLTFTLDVRTLLRLTGQTASADGIPAGVNPMIGYGGRVAINLTAWVDPKAGRMVKSSGAADFSMQLTFEHFPAGQAPSGNEVRFRGHMSISLESKA
jgi:hypothetical protein